MSLRWPEDEAPAHAPVPRRRRIPIPGEPFDPALEIFDTTPGSGIRRSIPVLILLVVLFVIGAVAFLLGPLPTVFPRACDACGFFRP